MSPPKPRSVSKTTEKQQTQWHTGGLCGFEASLFLQSSRAARDIQGEIQFRG